MPQRKGLGSGSYSAQGGGRGRNSGGGYGAGGYCVCAACGAKTTHARGVKCTDLRCPECGKVMIREELLKADKK